MEIRVELERKIESLKKQLSQYKVALAALNKAEGVEVREAGTPATRFLGMRPLHTIRDVLNQHGKPMPKAELRQALLDGGIAIGKKRAAYNVDVSIKVSVKTAALISTGKDELISLPEWAKKK
jgi:hypothetical protein